MVYNECLDSTFGTRLMIAYALTIFISAFLLFQVQPIIARYILPWYGGTPAVWTTCMLFFQVALVGGYAYAHLLRSRLTPPRQAIVHVLLLGLALAFLPITPDDAWKPAGPENAMFGIIRLLVATVGVPYLLLSATGPLLQHWFHHSRPGASPYRLYALSNLGSLLGLVTYPFAVEPLLALRSQTVSWSALFGVFVLAGIWCAVTVFRVATGSDLAAAGNPTGSDDIPRESGRPPEMRRRLLWLSLAACGSVMLLATTNQMCQNVAVIPFLWILPLSLYLASFIVCFDSERWYNRRVWIPFLVVTLAAVVYVLDLDYQGMALSIIVVISIYAAALFACCMICHGELARRKPHGRYLTGFYLMVAVGGALGGVFVGMVAPYLFNGYWEFHLGIVGTFVLLGICVLPSGGKRRFVVSPRVGLWAGGAAALVFGLGAHIYQQQHGVIEASRNFYGVLRVETWNTGTAFEIRALLHGAVTHGSQYVMPDLRSYPTTYYAADSGIRAAIENHPRRAIDHNPAPAPHAPENPGKGEPQTGLRIGMVGLGVGTICVYARKGDVVRIYEINQDVIRLAEEYFSFLEDTEADLTHLVGDARISMEREVHAGRSHFFDVIALDAFSGDAIPVHLLTREAFAIYWQLLRPDGILAVNITNDNVELSPVVRGLAAEFGKQAVWITNEDDPDNEIYGADWVLVTGNERFLTNEQVLSHVTEWSEPNPKKVIWTDDYSNLVLLLR